MYKIGEVGDLELREVYGKLCENGVLKDEYKIIERKGLTRALVFLQVFKMDWINIVLSQIHDGFLWLENGPIKITKRTIHRVTSYPTLDQPKSMRWDTCDNIKKETSVTWNKRGMSIDIIPGPMIEFVFRVIAHKFYQSSRLNCVPYIAVDLGFKIVKKDHDYDLAEL